MIKNYNTPICLYLSISRGQNENFYLFFGREFVIICYLLVYSFFVVSRSYTHIHAYVKPRLINQINHWPRFPLSEKVSIIFALNCFIRKKETKRKTFARVKLIIFLCFTTDIFLNRLRLFLIGSVITRLKSFFKKLEKSSNSRPCGKQLSNVINSRPKIMSNRRDVRETSRTV